MNPVAERGMGYASITGSDFIYTFEVGRLYRAAILIDFPCFQGELDLGQT